MPSNNSPARQAVRRKKAQEAEDRRKAERAAMQRENHNAVVGVLFATEQIVNAADKTYNTPEYILRHTHQCGNPANCGIPSAEACSALNQNLSAHLVVGQIPAAD